MKRITIDIASVAEITYTAESGKSIIRKD